MKNKKAQVWIETAVYTLIGLTIIAIILSVITPQIDKIKDRNIIEQTMIALNNIDSKILETEQTGGNIRIVDLKLAKGTLTIDSDNNQLVYTLENTKLEFSEPDIETKEGKIFIKTEKSNSRFKIILTLKYENLDITYNQDIVSKTLQPGTTPHKIKIENTGQEINNKMNIDFLVL